MVGVSLDIHRMSLKPIKFLCSYGGRILPRYPDGKLRYHGGDTRVLSVERSVSFSELLVKLGEMCGGLVSVRCQLPTEDLDALVSITSDEDLAHLLEEYDRVPPPPSPSPLSSIKIRAFLSCRKSSTQKVSSSPSFPKSPFDHAVTRSVRPRCPTSARGKCFRHASRPPLCPVAGKFLPPLKYTAYHLANGHAYLIHSGSNYWQ